MSVWFLTSPYDVSTSSIPLTFFLCSVCENLTESDSGLASRFPFPLFPCLILLKEKARFLAPVLLDYPNDSSQQFVRICCIF